MNKSDDNNARLDKWLWCARFYKTRSMAAEAIRSGHVKVNGERAKPSKTISAGMNIHLRKQAYSFDLKVKDIPKARLSAPKAALLYEETPASIQQREQISETIKAESALFPRTLGRPTKRDRRDIMKFKNRG